jgi:hypothetical protein
VPEGLCRASKHYFRGAQTTDANGRVDIAGHTLKVSRMSDGAMLAAKELVVNVTRAETPSPSNTWSGKRIFGFTRRVDRRQTAASITGRGSRPNGTHRAMTPITQSSVEIVNATTPRTYVRYRRRLAPWGRGMTVAVLPTFHGNAKARATLELMSYKLIFLLSLFGLAMGFATVFVIRPNIEPYAWLGIFALSALIIAKRAPGKYFLHGLCVSLVNSIWITAAHFALFDKYVAGHAREAAMAAQMGSARTMMLVSGPIIGLVSGIVLGLFAFVASKFVVSSDSDYAGW